VGIAETSTVVRLKFDDVIVRTGYSDSNEPGGKTRFVILEGIRLARVPKLPFVPYPGTRESRWLCDRQGGDRGKVRRGRFHMCGFVRWYGLMWFGSG